MDRLTITLSYQWIAWWRRLFRSGSAAKNNFIVIGLVALFAGARYFPFLRTVKGNQIWYLLGAAVFLIASSLRNNGPIESQALLRFPLSTLERAIVKTGSALIPPWSWIVLIFALGILTVSVPGAVLAIVVGVAASQVDLPWPLFRRRPNAQAMTLLRKEIRYILREPEQTFIVLISLAFCAYLVGGQGIQADAFRAVLGILAVLSTTAPMNFFGRDGAAGLDRYALLPLAGSKIISTKNAAFTFVIAAQRAPVIALAIWRMGPLESAYGLVEIASLILSTMAWGNLVSVRHPAPPDSEPLLTDQFIGFAASAAPAAFTIMSLRGSSSLAPARMLSMLVLCGVLYCASLRFSGPYFTRRVEWIRSALA